MTKVSRTCGLFSSTPIFPIFTVKLIEEEEEAFALPFALEVAAFASLKAVLEASSVASARVWRTSLISAGLHKKLVSLGKQRGGRRTERGSCALDG